MLRIRGNAEVERAVLERRHAFGQLITDLVDEAERDGDIRVGFDPAITARLLSGMVHSLVEWGKPAGQSVGSALAEGVCTVAFDGLRVRADRAGG